MTRQFGGTVSFPQRRQTSYLDFVEFSDFSGGDSGRERPLANDLTRYRGINTWRYPNGALGPRPPWITIPYTGLPTGKTLRTFTTAVDVAGSWLAWTFSDGTVYTTVPGSTVAALRGTLGNDPTDAMSNGDAIYFISINGTGGGKVDKAGAFTAITTPIAELITQKGSQTIALRQSDSKLFWSDPDDPTTWPAANVVFVGNRTPATGVYIQRDTIVVTKINGEIWLFTGTLGVNEVLRQVDIGLIHPYAAHAKGAIAGNSVLYYTTGSKMTAFTGGQLKTLSRPDMPETALYNSSPKTDNVGSVVSSGEPNQFVVLGTMDLTATPTTRKAWFHSFSPEQGWNRHVAPIAPYTISAAAIGGLTSADSAKAIRTSLHLNGTVVICRPSDASGVTTVKTYFFIPRLETPYNVSVPMQWGSVTALADGDLSTPVVASMQSGESWTPEGRDTHVRALIIDYSYDADANIPLGLGAEIPHKVDVVVEALQRESGASQASAAQTLTASGGNSIDGGTMYRARATLRFGDQGPGPGFRFKLSDWRGILIHRVIAAVDVSEARF